MLANNGEWDGQRYLSVAAMNELRKEQAPDFLDDTVDWATYDSLNQLVVARRGVVTVYALRAKNQLTQRFEFDFESLAPEKPA